MRWPGGLIVAVVIGTIAAGCGVGEDSDGAVTTIAAEGVDDRMIDIGGYRLHLVCAGSGSPTVIVEMGFTAVASDWAERQSVLASSTRTCVYERAGTGSSELGPLPRTSQRLADELSELIHAAGIDTPVVLVGESGGGTTLQAFSQRHRDEVAGLVFADPRLAEYEDQAGSVLAPQEQAVIDRRIDALPAPLSDEVRAGPESIAGILVGAGLPDVPVIVLTAGVQPPERGQADIALWIRSHEHLVADLPQGRHQVVADAPHLIPVGPLAEAVEEVLAAIRA